MTSPWTPATLTPCCASKSARYCGPFRSCAPVNVDALDDDVGAALQVDAVPRACLRVGGIARDRAHQRRTTTVDRQPALRVELGSVTPRGIDHPHATAPPCRPGATAATRGTGRSRRPCPSRRSPRARSPCGHAARRAGSSSPAPRPRTVKPRPARRHRAPPRTAQRSAARSRELPAGGIACPPSSSTPAPWAAYPRTESVRRACRARTRVGPARAVSGAEDWSRTRAESAPETVAAGQ